MVKAAIVMAGPSILFRPQKGQDSSKILDSILSLQMLILPKSSPNKYYFLAEGDHFKKNNSLKSDSMSGHSVYLATGQAF